MIRSRILQWIVSLIATFFVLAPDSGSAQKSGPELPSGETFALELRDHVVKIRARWQNSEQEGFGFVVGDNETGIYIVTANHVVRGSAPGEVAEEVMLTWYRRAGEEFPATLIGTSERSRDVAVLRSELPEGIILRPELMVYPSGRLTRRTPVWYVGRAGAWYVPSQAGTVNSVNLDEQILPDGLNLQVGTSGAPLISDGGIAGMIVEDSGGVARATEISFIARAFEVWAHPWDMRMAAANEPSSAAPRGAPSMGEQPVPPADLTPNPDIEERRARTSALLFALDDTIHIGDERIRGWSDLTGSCYSMWIDVQEDLDILEVSFEVYGAEETAIIIDGQAQPFFRQSAQPGNIRPNYWSDQQALKIATSANPRPQTMQICAEPVPNPERAGDLDDFMIRNLVIEGYHGH